MYIYLVTNTVNGKLYVGQTVKTPKARWAEHVRDSRRGCPFLFHRAIRKYGASAFEIQEVATATNQTQLDQLETSWIQQLDTMSPSGYNTKLGRQGHVTENVRARISATLTGIRRSDDTRRRMSEAKKGTIPWSAGKELSSETKAKMSLAQKGRVVSEDCRKKLSIANIGKTKSAETRAKMSIASKARPISQKVREAAWEANRGQKRSEETRALLRKARVGRVTFLGHKHTPEARQKMSDSKRGRHLSQETREKIGKAMRAVNTGRKWSEETRTKIMATRKRRQEERCQ